MMFKRRPLGQNRQGQPSSESGGFSQATGGLPANQNQGERLASESAQPHTPTPGQLQPRANPQQNQRTQQNQGQGQRQNRNRNANRNQPRGPASQAQGTQAQGQAQGAQGQPGQGPQQGPQQGNNQQPGQNQRRNRNQNNRNQNQNQNQRAGKGPGGSSQRNAQNNRGQNRNQRPRPEPRRAPPPPPPAFIQRDVLLVPQPGAVEGIEVVRAKFDPLAKKVPAHVTLVFPEPADSISKDLLKEFSRGELPALDSITFTSVIVHEDMYLWLVPDEDSKEKLTLWRDALMRKLKNRSGQTEIADEETVEEESGTEAENAEAPEESDDESAGEPFIPHMTLGYIPRSITSDDAVAFVKTHVTLPLIVPLEKIMLEEFPESQVSTQLDSLALNAQESQ